MKLRWMLLAIPIALAIVFGYQRLAQGNTNPNTSGGNYAITAPNNLPRAIAAAGNNCSATIQVDFDPRDGGGSVSTPVCSGYNTGGTTLTKYNCMMPVCTDATKCVSTWVTRDTAPGVLSVMAINAPTDAGVPIRIELSAGCKSP